MLNQALGRAGYDVRTTGTAAGLWRWISAGEGNLVITDVVLPDENGFDLIPRIKRMRPELPIVVMSAQNTHPDRHHRGRTRRLRISAQAVRPEGADQRRAARAGEPAEQARTAAPKPAKSACR